MPILGDIPVLGNLFRSKDRTKGRTELVVFLTPHIVRDRKEGDEILNYERKRAPVDPLKLLDAPFAKPLDVEPADIRPGKHRK